MCEGILVSHKRIRELLRRVDPMGVKYYIRQVLHQCKHISFPSVNRKFHFFCSAWALGASGKTTCSMDSIITLHACTRRKQRIEYSHKQVFN